MPTTVYGYIRREDDNEAEVDRLHDQLTAHAATAGWHLAEVFVDRCMPPARIVRPGLALLVDTIRAAEDCAVLVVDDSHFSTLLPVRRAIEEEIAGTGCPVLAVAAPDSNTSPVAP
ncbi:recombinase family protein [Pseudofrankia sp. DC12]|uniref:recombinase family protein n=1 Tax=Pseudofrankia sp. DC12 TaxID=683315 RepID=UPI0005F87EE7|nr:recombinase family protein [Pseudofrankia sp. DC12]